MKICCVCGATDHEVVATVIGDVLVCPKLELLPGKPMLVMAPARRERMGWRYVGRLYRSESKPYGLELQDSGSLPADSLFAIASAVDAPFRCGLARIDEFEQITAACEGDYVFVATAIGEHAFRPRAAL